MSAHASVNHLHFHAYYLPIPSLQLPLALARRSPLAPGVSELADYPAAGFAFDMSTKDGEVQLKKAVHATVQAEIAHNLVILGRGTLVVLFPRQSFVGVKGTSDVCVALTELAGHFVFKRREEFEAADIHDVTERMRQVSDRSATERVQCALWKSEPCKE